VTGPFKPEGSDHEKDTDEGAAHEMGDLQVTQLKMVGAA
jgi:hypothetical protein